MSEETRTARSESETSRVARTIRDQILDGDRAPGSKLVERDLADELGVSRIPVRDALKTLATEGLVTPRPRTWAVVRTFSPADVADLNEVRSALEVLTFRLAASRRTPDGLTRLRQVLMTEHEAVRVGDSALARKAAADFHEQVTMLAGNTLLQEIGGHLKSRIRWLLLQHEDVDGVVHEHQALFDAIAQRDVARVSNLILAHMGNIRYLDDPTWRDDDAF
jgi:DNA-binding GntR family transcriptional regulator